jgi:hypothetical protein
MSAASNRARARHPGSVSAGRASRQAPASADDHHAFDARARSSVRHEAVARTLSAGPGPGGRRRWLVWSVSVPGWIAVPGIRGARSGPHGR